MGSCMIKFKRKSSESNGQYFEGKRIVKKTSYGKKIVSYRVDKVFVIDKYREGYIEVQNNFKGVNFLPNEIEVL